MIPSRNYTIYISFPLFLPKFPLPYFSHLPHSCRCFLYSFFYEPLVSRLSEVCIKYLNSFTSSILFPLHHHLNFFYLPPPFLNSIILVFNFKSFLFRYPSNLSVILFISPLFSAIKTMSSAYVVNTFLSPHTLPIHFSHFFFQIRYQKIKQRFSGYPCLTSLAVQKSSSISSPFLILLFVSLTTSLLIHLSTLSFLSLLLKFPCSPCQMLL